MEVKFRIVDAHSANAAAERGDAEAVSEDEDTARRRTGVQVIARAAHVLRQLAAEPHGITLLDLAGRAGLPRSTTHRIVQALAREGFVANDHAGRLRIGPSLIGMAVAGRRELRHEAGPYLERLSRELHETVNLAVLDGGEVLFIDQCTAYRYLRIASEIGARFPVHCTANGKALLALLPPDEVERRLPRRLPALTDHTITDRDALIAELDRVRQVGVAYDREEHAVGVSAVAAAFRDAVGASAAITVVMPAARFTDAEQAATAALLRTRDEIEAVLRGI